MFSQLWNLFHTIVTCSKGWAPCYGKRIVYCMVPNKDMYLLKKMYVSSEDHCNTLYTSIFKPHWRYTYKYASTCFCATKANEINASHSSHFSANKFFRPSVWCTFDLPGDRQFVPRNSWEAELLLQLQERLNHTLNPRLSESLRRMRNNSLEVFFVLRTIFTKLWKNLEETTDYEEWFHKDCRHNFT